MEKKNAAAIVASKATVSASDVAVVASKAIPVKATVPISDVVVDVSWYADRGKIPLDWDPYEEEEYIRPENPYDTSLVDPWPEVDSSDVGTDDESRDTKDRQVLRRLQSGQYDAYFVKYVYMCPFCTRRLGATDFNCVVTHVENVSSCNPKVDETVNVNAFYAKHKVLGIHLRKVQQVAIAKGRIAPIKSKEPKIKGHGRKKWKKRPREEPEARWW